jgi:hypothetical protein
MFFQTVNPAIGELVQTFEAISGDDLEVALATAHNVYETDWRLRPVAVSRAATASPPRFRGEDNVAVLRRPGRRRRRDPARFGIPQPVKQGRHLTKQIERIKKCN